MTTALFQMVSHALLRLELKYAHQYFVISPAANSAYNTLPNIVSLMLFPNIHEFQAEHPELNIQIDSDVSRIDLEHSEINVAIRHSNSFKAFHSPKVNTMS